MSKNGKNGETFTIGSIPANLAVSQAPVAEEPSATNDSAASTGNASVAIDVPLLNLPVVSLEGLSIGELRRAGTVLKEQAKKVYDWVTNLLPVLEEFLSLEREIREVAGAQIKEAEGRLNRLLKEDKTPAYRRAAWLAYLQYFFSKKLKKEDTEHLVERLVKDGFIKPAQNGAIEIGYGKTFDVAPESCFDKQEVEVVKKAAKVMMAKAESMVEQAQRERVRALREQSHISVRDLRNGIPGTCIVGVPPQKVEGTDAWRPGGEILFEGYEQDNEKRICVVEGIGKPTFEAAVSEAASLGAFVPVDSLGEKRPPKIKEHDQDTQRKDDLLWHLLQRGFAAAEAEEKFSAAKEELKLEAETSEYAATPEEFFLDGKQPAECLANFEGCKKIEGKREAVYHIFFIVRRTGSDPSTIFFVKVPDHLKEFLPFEGKEYGEGQNFVGLPPRAADLMRDIRGQLARKRRIAAQSQQVLPPADDGSANQAEETVVTEQAQ